MKALKYFSTLLIMSLAFLACNNTPAEQAKSANEEKYFDGYRLEEDAAFFVDYASFLNFSTKMADLAATKIGDENIKIFAREMTKDHQMMQSELNQLAAKYKVELPEKLSMEQDAQLDFLISDNMLGIDQLYLSQVIRHHQEWEPMLKEVIAETKVDTILNFARKINSHQFRHLERAKRLAGENAPTS